MRTRARLLRTKVTKKLPNTPGRVSHKPPREYIGAYSEMAPVKAKDIIQVSSYYPPHLGGQENAVYDLAGQLANAGHHVQVLTSAVGSGVIGAKREGGVLVKRLRGLVFGQAPIMPAFPAEL